MTPAAIVDQVVDSGLRGRGGAAFPTGIKWKTVLATEASQKYIVCNADEGDSGTFSDRMLMEGDPYVLIEGMAIAGLAVQATRSAAHTSQLQSLMRISYAVSSVKEKTTDYLLTGLSYYTDSFHTHQ